MRSLTPEEAELWARVAATIRPLSREAASSPERGGGQLKTAEDGRPSVESAVAIRPRPAAKPGSSPPHSREELKPLSAASLDSGWDRRLRSGSIEPDRVLDLHGRNLDQAWRAIDEALGRAIAAGERVLLLITGHPRAGDPPVERGRIRAAVFDWLASSPHSRNIAAVRPAHPRHGGTGSLYIILRRTRASSTFS